MAHSKRQVATKQFQHNPSVHSLWEPLTAPKKTVFPGFEEERELSSKIKQQTPILVMLGNSPYNSYSGVAAGEEKELVEPYKKDLTSKWGIRKYTLDELSIRRVGDVAVKMVRRCQGEGK